VSVSRVDVDDKEGKFQLVVGQESFLSLVTSCIVCIVKSEPTVVEHLLSWGYSHRLCAFLARALDNDRRGSPVTSVTRILHQLVVRPEVLDDLSGCPHDLMHQIMRTFDVTNGIKNTVEDIVQLPAESTLLAELLKKIFRNTSCQSLPSFVETALRVQLPEFLLTNIIGASQDSLSSLRNSSALKIHTVEALKAMMEADERNSSNIRAILDGHPAWQEYRGQSHDLFLTNKEQVDVFLIEDSSEKRFAGLLGYDSKVSFEGGKISETKIPAPPAVIDVGAASVFTPDNSARRVSEVSRPSSLSSSGGRTTQPSTSGSATSSQVVTPTAKVAFASSSSPSNPFAEPANTSLPQPSKIIKLVGTESSHQQKNILTVGAVGGAKIVTAGDVVTTPKSKDGSSAAKPTSGQKSPSAISSNAVDQRFVTSLVGTTICRTLF